MKILGIETIDKHVYQYETPDHLTDPNITISRDCIILKNFGNYEVISHPMVTIRRWWVADKKNVSPDALCQGSCYSQ